MNLKCLIIIFILNFSLMANLSLAKDECISVTCHSAIPTCILVKENAFLAGCTADVQLGGGTCSKFVSCQFVKSECQAVKKNGADSCLGCYDECRRAINIQDISQDKKWAECIAACAKKNKLSL